MTRQSFALKTPETSALSVKSLAQRVSSEAVSLSKVAPWWSVATSLILSMGYSFQVTRINTKTVAAQVIEFGVFRNGSTRKLVGDSVSQRATAAATTNGNTAIPSSECSCCPRPAGINTSRAVNLAPEPRRKAFPFMRDSCTGAARATFSAISKFRWVVVTEGAKHHG